MELTDEEYIKMRRDQLKKDFKDFYGNVELSGNIEINWSIKGIGFGSTYIYNEDEKIHIMNECMSKEFIKKLLCKLVDDAILEDDIINEWVTEELKLTDAEIIIPD